MPNHDGYLQRVYELETQAETDRYYSDWAATYDAEVTSRGYRTPRRSIAALQKFVDPSHRVLDVGCGTGIFGVALHGAGFTEIDGTDVNGNMLSIAERRGVYRHTWLGAVDDQFPFAAGTYDALAAIGVIGVGAAPPSLLAEALDALAPGGFLVFSYNEHALDVPEYREALATALNPDGPARIVYEERGTHFVDLGTSSIVYVLERT